MFSNSPGYTGSINYLWFEEEKCCILFSMSCSRTCITLLAIISLNHSCILSTDSNPNSSPISSPYPIVDSRWGRDTVSVGTVQCTLYWKMQLTLQYTEHYTHLDTVHSNWLLSAHYSALHTIMPCTLHTAHMSWPVMHLVCSSPCTLNHSLAAWQLETRKTRKTRKLDKIES